MEVVSKPCQDQFLHPILVHSISEKKENTGSQMGHTKKNNFKKKRKKRKDLTHSKNRLAYLIKKK